MSVLLAITISISLAQICLSRCEGVCMSIRMIYVYITPPIKITCPLSHTLSVSICMYGYPAARHERWSTSGIEALSSPNSKKGGKDSASKKSKKSKTKSASSSPSIRDLSTRSLAISSPPLRVKTNSYSNSNSPIISSRYNYDDLLASSEANSEFSDPSSSVLISSPTRGATRAREISKVTKNKSISLKQKSNNNNNINNNSHVKLFKINDRVFVPIDYEPHLAVVRHLGPVQGFDGISFVFSCFSLFSGDI